MPVAGANRFNAFNASLVGVGKMAKRSEKSFYESVEARLKKCFHGAEIFRKVKIDVSKWKDLGWSIMEPDFLVRDQNRNRAYVVEVKAGDSWYVTQALGQALGYKSLLEIGCKVTGTNINTNEKKTFEVKEDIKILLYIQLL